jgi:hypothetical protein
MPRSGIRRLDRWFSNCQRMMFGVLELYAQIVKSVQALQGRWK